MVEMLLLLLLLFLLLLLLLLELGEQEAWRKVWGEQRKADWVLRCFKQQLPAQAASKI
jgi:competence protein ComGC